MQLLYIVPEEYEIYHVRPGDKTNTSQNNKLNQENHNMPAEMACRL